MAAKHDYKNIYLIGTAEEEIQSAKLPTIHQVFKLFFYKFYVLNQPLTESTKNTIEEVQVFWNKAEIRTCRLQHAVSKFNKLF